MGEHGGVFNLIGREFGGNNYCLESKWILFDPGLPAGSPSFPTGKVLPVAVVPAGTQEKVPQIKTSYKFSDRRTMAKNGGNIF